MKTKAPTIVAIVCLVLGLFLGAFINPGTPGPAPSPAPVVPVPDPVPDDPYAFSVAIGEQVKITIDTGSAVDWTVEPPIPDLTTYGDRNESSVSSYRSAGKYTILAAVAEKSVLSGPSVTIRRFTVTVSGDPSPDPTPGPDPGPSPAPTPEPVPTPVVGEFSHLAPLVPDKAEAQRLAAAFRETATEVDGLVKKRKLLSPDDIVALSQEANEKALGPSLPKWAKFFDALETDLTKRAKDGKLNTMTQHVSCWNELATFLESLK